MNIKLKEKMLCCDIPFNVTLKLLRVLSIRKLEGFFSAYINFAYKIVNHR